MAGEGLVFHVDGTVAHFEISELRNNTISYASDGKQGMGRLVRDDCDQLAKKE